MTKSISFSPRVLELLASKICHDLVSPVGAISNGVEFWTEMGADSAEDSMDLISHSANQAALRLQIFRLAYGAGGSEKHIALKDIHAALEEYLDTDRHTINWDIDNEELDGILPIGFCKTLLNLIILIADVTPKGGEITLSGNVNGPSVDVQTTSDMIKLKDGYAEILGGEINDEDLDARNVHPHIMMLLADHYGLTISHDLKDGEINFTLSTNQD